MNGTQQSGFAQAVPAQQPDTLIGSRLSVIGSSLATLHSNISKLEQRLCHVLTPTGPSAGDTTGVPINASCSPLASVRPVGGLKAWRLRS